MPPHTINLRSDSPALLVEFNLPPGTHARIGASPEAEVTLPLVGLAPFSCIIGRFHDGRLYLADSEGGLSRRIELPAALPLPPYHFVIFQPAAHEIPIPPMVRLQPLRKSKLLGKRLALIGAGLVVGCIAAWFIWGSFPRKLATAVRPESGHPGFAPAPEIKTDPAAMKVEPTVGERPIIASTGPEKSPDAEIRPADVSLRGAAEAFDLEELAQRIAPSVFRLDVTNAAGKHAGLGTAFAISADGLAITNFHVVDGGESFTARTTQGAEFAVSGVLAIDAKADLALIRITGSNLPFLELGQSEALKIGAALVVFGSPRGLTGSLSTGILSAKRTEQDLVGDIDTNGGRLLQITAPISGGSSGSPVLDSTGKVIGVVVSQLSNQSAQNINFVIPVEAVEKLRKDFLAGVADVFKSPAEESPLPEASSNSPQPSANAGFYQDPDYPALNRHLESSDWIAALKLAKPMASRHSEAPAAYLNQGLALHCLGLNEQAEQSIKRGLALAPENAALWRLLGYAQDAQKNTRDARESWKKSAAIEPDSIIPWERLTVSYLREREYLDAVSPMENLRKLNRARFDELLASVRALRVHPSELQSLLHHFDNLPEIVAEAPTDPEELAAVLVDKFLRNGQGPDIQAELADYAATVDPYFDQGAQKKPAIFKDLSSYRKQWPQRSLRLLAVESARRDDLNSLEATYRLTYSASDGKRNRSGTLIQGIRYTLTGKRWLVSGIQTIERVQD